MKMLFAVTASGSYIQCQAVWTFGLSQRNIFVAKIPFGACIIRDGILKGFIGRTSGTAPDDGKSFTDDRMMLVS
jgi:hypothetical protein